MKEEKPEPKKEEKPKPKEDKEPKAAKKKAGSRRFKSTHIDHHDNGSHTVRHEPLPSAGGKEPPDGPPQDMSYAVPDNEALHSSLAENLGGGPGPQGPSAGAGPEPEAALQRLSTGQ